MVALHKRKVTKNVLGKLLVFLSLALSTLTVNASDRGLAGFDSDFFLAMTFVLGTFLWLHSARPKEKSK